MLEQKSRKEKKEWHMFRCLLIFRRQSTREPASHRPTQEPVLTAANTGKTRKKF